MVDRIKDVAITAAAKVYGGLVKLTPAMWKAMDVAGLVFDTPQDLQRLGYNPTMAGGQAHAPAVPDPVRNATGISTHLATTIASHVLAKAVVWAKGRRKSESGDVDFEGLAAVLFEALTALAGEFGLSEPPAAATIAANLRKLSEGK